VIDVLIRLWLAEGFLVAHVMPHMSDAQATVPDHLPNSASLFAGLAATGDGFVIDPRTSPQRDLDAKMAEKKADELEWEANVAIDYAIASVEQAEWAALDAVAARVQAQQAKAS
jgi:hypothetical protein